VWSLAQRAFVELRRPWVIATTSLVAAHSACVTAALWRLAVPAEAPGMFVPALSLILWQEQRPTQRKLATILESFSFFALPNMTNGVVIKP
jgi:hypothetical protein